MVVTTQQHTAKRTQFREGPGDGMIFGALATVLATLFGASQIFRGSISERQCVLDDRSLITVGVWMGAGLWG